MGIGHKHHPHFKFHVQLHLPSFHHHENKIEEFRELSKGCVAVMVGQGEEQQRFVVPVMHINHPLFVQLLKGAEDEVEFHHDGPINVPCHVEEFRHVEDIIQHDDNNNNNNNNNHHLWCFKA